MSQNAGALSPARGNRRFIILAMVLGLMGAGLVYVASSRGSSSPSGTASAADTPVVVAKVDIAARTSITSDMIEVKLVPANDRNALGYGTLAAVTGQVTRYPITAGEQVLSTKVVALDNGSIAKGRSLSYVIPQGMRAIAIQTSAITGAGGLVLPGDYVDILIDYDINFTAPDGSQQKVPSYLVQTLMQNVEVLAVSQTIVDTVTAPAASSDAAASATPTGSSATGNPTPIARNSEAAAQPGASTITLALSPEDAQKIFLAEQNGKIRLAVRPYGDSENLPIDYETQVDLFPKNLPNPFTR